MPTAKIRGFGLGLDWVRELFREKSAWLGGGIWSAVTVLHVAQAMRRAWE
jgi:hypothetical protein